VKKSILVFICFLFSFTSNANDQFTSEQLIEKAKAFVAAKMRVSSPTQQLKK